MYAKSECEHTGEEGWSRITKSELMNFIDDLLHDSEPLAIKAFSYLLHREWGVVV